MSVRNGDWPLLLIVMTTSLALMLVGFATGFQTDLSVKPELLQAPTAEAGYSWLSALGRILMANIPALCLVFSGVITGGISTLISWPLITVYIGSTMRMGQNLIGIDGVLVSIWIYAPIEFLALVLGAGAGLLPIATAIRSALSDTDRLTPLKRYLSAFPLAVKTFGIALALLLAAAFIEATVLATRGLIA